MPVNGKRRAQLKVALAKRYEAKKAIAHLPPEPEKSPLKPDVFPIQAYEYPDNYPDNVHQHVHWEGLSDSEEESDIEMSEPEDTIDDEGKDAFDTMMQATKGLQNGKWGDRLLYLRGSTVTQRHERRKRAADRVFHQAAKTQSQSVA
jgi:hypothetical protein